MLAGARAAAMTLLGSVLRVGSAADADSRRISHRSAISRITVLKSKGNGRRGRDAPDTPATCVAPVQDAWSSAPHYTNPALPTEREIEAATNVRIPWDSLRGYLGTWHRTSRTTTYHLRTLCAPPSTPHIITRLLYGMPESFWGEQ